MKYEKHAAVIRESEIIMNVVTLSQPLLIASSLFTYIRLSMGLLRLAGYRLSTMES